jgi:hypothetical protein
LCFALLSVVPAFFFHFLLKIKKLKPPDILWSGPRLGKTVSPLHELDIFFCGFVRYTIMKNTLVVIGGSDAGISAGLRAKELSPHTEVTMILPDRYRL